MKNTVDRLAWVRAAAAIAGVTVACWAGASAMAQPTAPGAIVPDGDHADWAGVGTTGIHADARYLYARARTGAVRSLGTSDQPLRFEFDLDGDPKTGAAVGGLGVDLLVEFAPRVEGERRGRGPRIEGYVGGQTRRLEWQEIGLYSGPTHASDSFELRLDRALLGGAGLPGSAAGQLRGRVTLLSNDGAAVASGGEIQSVPAPAAVSPSPSQATVPPKPQGAVRLVSYNVLWGSPHREPASFSRVLRALEPDIVLAQEWQLQARGQEARGPQIGEPELEAWFGEHAPASADQTWTAETNDGLGVALITRLPLSRRGPQRVITGDTTRWDFPVRLASGVIDSPIGPIVIGSVHLKASGSLGSEEDTRRLAEADKVNGVMRELAAGLRNPLIIVGGDFNMNGTTGVIDRVRRGLDGDGSDLEIARPLVLGEALAYTFVGQPDEGRPTAVRLDYFTYPGAQLRVAQAFVLDTSRLDAQALRSAGLQAGDSWGSDHLPVVIDLLPAQAPN
ncbi:MAG: hypothetical protein C0475_03130 [Planctomyces sp.]|nr:hypothetical protein [Planctomyces sp.]MBA4119765.1 hypothetical protein [Isosphaera sp.]